MQQNNNNKTQGNKTKQRLTEKVQQKLITPLPPLPLPQKTLSTQYDLISP